VEIEGPSEKAVEAIRRTLQIEGEHIPSSYLHLLMEHGRGKNPQADQRTSNRPGDRA
jgi:hypothetical protein